MDDMHFQTLQQRHADLDEKIRKEMQRPAPDDIRISQLKKRKLRIKEELFA